MAENVQNSIKIRTNEFADPLFCYTSLRFLYSKGKMLMQKGWFNVFLIVIAVDDF